VALYFFGIRRGLTRDKAARMAGDSLAPMGALLCIMGGGGALKQVIVDSGVGPYAGSLLASASVSPLIVAYLISAALRLAQGSATVAIITAAGIVAPVVRGMPGYDADLTVLALCCGGSGYSHVNDAGFWLVNEYFGMTVPQTLRTWTAMKIAGSLTGLALVMAFSAWGR
jgi:GntP family gluconate:H+ symporter/Gnt-I system low-affinity gluconate transporter